MGKTEDFVSSLGEFVGRFHLVSVIEKTDDPSTPSVQELRAFIDGIGYACAAIELRDIAGNTEHAIMSMLGAYIEQRKQEAGNADSDD